MAEFAAVVQNQKQMEMVFSQIPGLTELLSH